ncbi:hypothetical protein [Kallipyga massiliensis]|uniref:hypothetical protein n=1 Tax=Kallipyga massiliensis TaxID=1472764 RepID=UPI0026F0B959|nr:hypothetical protein [Kallipyga massiliensis]
MEKKTSEAQIRASKKWNAQNPERRRYNSAKSAARSFIRNRATFEDLEELESLIAEKREKLKEGE